VAGKGGAHDKSSVRQEALLQPNQFQRKDVTRQEFCPEKGGGDSFSGKGQGRPGTVRGGDEAKWPRKGQRGEQNRTNSESKGRGPRKRRE